MKPNGNVAKLRVTVPAIPADVKIMSRSGQFVVLLGDRNYKQKKHFRLWIFIWYFFYQVHWNLWLRSNWYISSRRRQDFYKFQREEASRLSHQKRKYLFKLIISKKLALSNFEVEQTNFYYLLTCNSKVGPPKKKLNF